MGSIIKGEKVRVDAVASLSSVCAGEPHASPSPGRAGATVELLRVDGRVHALQVRCRCGEVTVVEIEYESDPGGPEANE